MTNTNLPPLRALMRGLDWPSVGLAFAVAMAVAALWCVPAMSLAAFGHFLMVSGVFAAALLLALTIAGNCQRGTLSQVLMTLAAVAGACIVGIVAISALQGMDLLRELTHSAGRKGVASTLAIGLATGVAMIIVMALRERFLRGDKP
ncbi:MAG: hypothetical protein H7Y33_02775 [Cytophagales bacterium]|nr:hypothetical protein [Rhizobacter sp.]